MDNQEIINEVKRILGLEESCENGEIIPHLVNTLAQFKAEMENAIENGRTAYKKAIWERDVFKGRLSLNGIHTELAK